jgi:hypothetical protein
MDWPDNSTEYVMNRDAESWITEVYTDYRNRGLDADIALEQTALDFGITPRRVRSFKSGWHGTVAQEEWRELKRRFMAHLDQEAAYAMKRHADRTERLKKMRQEHDQTRNIR